MGYTTKWQIVAPAAVGWQQSDQTSTTKQHQLGMRVQAQEVGNSNGWGEFIYAKGVADTAVGSWVTFNEDDWSTALLAANAVGKVGVALSANVANQYGWYQVSGKAVGKALAAFADNGNVYATATAGSVDDTAVAGDRVHRAKGASALDAPATGMAEFELDNPEMDDGLGSGS